MNKFWESIRGYKRHAGAVVVIIPVLLQLFGMNNTETDAIYKTIEIIGTAIWGIGWIDRGSVAIKDKQVK